MRNDCNKCDLKGAGHALSNFITLHVCEVCHELGESARKVYMHIDPRVGPT